MHFEWWSRSGCRFWWCFIWGNISWLGKGFSNNKILKHRPEFADLGYEFIDFSEEKEDEYIGDEMAEVITKEEREYIESVTSNKSQWLLIWSPV